MVHFQLNSLCWLIHLRPILTMTAIMKHSRKFLCIKAQVHLKQDWSYAGVFMLNFKRMHREEETWMFLLMTWIHRRCTSLCFMRMILLLWITLSPTYSVCKARADEDRVIKYLSFDRILFSCRMFTQCVHVLTVCAYGTFYPVTCHKGTDGRYRYNSTLSCWCIHIKYQIK